MKITKCEYPFTCKFCGTETNFTREDFGPPSDLTSSINKTKYWLTSDGFDVTCPVCGKISYKVELKANYHPLVGLDELIGKYKQRLESAKEDVDLAGTFTLGIASQHQSFCEEVLKDLRALEKRNDELWNRKRGT